MREIRGQGVVEMRGQGVCEMGGRECVKWRQRGVTSEESTRAGSNESAIGQGVMRDKG